MRHGTAAEIERSGLPIRDQLDWALETIRQAEAPDPLNTHSLEWQFAHDLGLYPTPARIAARLARSLGNPVGHDSLALLLPEENDRVSDSRSLTVAVSHIRRRLKPAGITIRNYFGTAYQMDAPDELFAGSPRRLSLPPQATARAQTSQEYHHG